jgi:hypothetical protein
MLGEDAEWVRNVRASGRAVLRRGKREAVRLEELPAEQRAPILAENRAFSAGYRKSVPSLDERRKTKDDCHIRHSSSVLRLQNADQICGWMYLVQAITCSIRDAKIRRGEEATSFATPRGHPASSPLRLKPGSDL